MELITCPDRLCPDAIRLDRAGESSARILAKSRDLDGYIGAMLLAIAHSLEPLRHSCP